MAIFLKDRTAPKLGCDIVQVKLGELQLHRPRHGNGPQAVGGMFGRNLIAIAMDDGGKLWVAVADLAAPGMAIIDSADDSVEDPLIDTGLNPGKTVFCETN